jgi:hypothetical protein
MKNYLILIFIVSLGGCSFGNIFKGSNDFYKNYYSDVLICKVDLSTVEESDKKLPNGYLTKEYSPIYWQEYWNHHIHYVGKDGPESHEEYVGPTGETIVKYTLQLRREMKLPDIIPDARNEVYLKQLYKELDNGSKDSCGILHWNSPVCVHSPVHYPGSPELKRDCRARKN